jgi:hypothetical protein
MEAVEDWSLGCAWPLDGVLSFTNQSEQGTQHPKKDLTKHIEGFSQN